MIENIWDQTQKQSHARNVLNRHQKDRTRDKTKRERQLQIEGSITYTWH